MIALNKGLLCVALIVVGTHSFSQRKHDLGVLFSKSNQSKVALEYRLSLGEKYRFKVGTQFGSQSNSIRPFSRLISANDSVVVNQIFDRNESSNGIRVGIERQLKSSPFSIIADLNLDYIRQSQTYRNDTSLFIDGIWRPQNIIYSNFSSLSNSSILGINFLDLSIRVGLAADFKISEHFIINTTLAGSIGTRFFLNESFRNDPLNAFADIDYSGFSYISFNTTASIGLRYQFSGCKKDK